MYFNYEMRQTNWDVYIGLQLATKWNPYLHIPLVDEHFLDYDLCVVSLVVPQSGCHTMFATSQFHTDELVIIKLESNYMI